MLDSNFIDSLSQALRRPVDDAYSAWFNAQLRSNEAFRAWSAAPRADRAAAYREYVVELELEEIAAAELERLHGPRLAA